MTRALFTILLLALPGAAHGHAFYQHFEGRQSHPLALSPDGTRLFSVNSSDGRLSVFDVTDEVNPLPVLILEIPVGMEPVSVRPRTDDEVWVVNEASDCVSIVSVSRAAVVETIQTPDEPADVAFANGRAFITCRRTSAVRVLDAATRVELSIISLPGLQPHAMTVTGSGAAARVYVSCLLSGNGTSILPASQAPPPPSPTNGALPAAPQSGLIVAAGDPRLAYTVRDDDVYEISADSLTVTRTFSGAGTVLFDIAAHPVTGDLWVAGTEARNAVRFEPALRAHAVEHRLSRIHPATGAVSVHNLNPDVDYNTLPNPAAAATALAQPAGILFAPDGSHAWVTAFASDRVARMAPDGTVLVRTDLRAPGEGARRMRGPRGLALLAQRNRLFVSNKLSASISVLDATTGALLGESPATGVPNFSPDVREGRGFLFDARLSGNGLLSCACCHVDADRDGLAWDLGDPGGDMATVHGRNRFAGGTTLLPRVMHPMKGPMVTPSLAGYYDSASFNHRGDRATMAGLSTKFTTLLGGPPLAEADVNSLAAYLFTLRPQPNPNRNLNGTLPAALGGGNPVIGQQRFYQSGNKCAVCHLGGSGSDENIDDRTVLNLPDHVKTAPLRTVYQRLHFNPAPGGVSRSGFGLAHDGSAASLPLPHVFTQHSLTAADLMHVAAFLQCFDSVAPAITGQCRTVTPANRNSAPALAGLALLEGQAALFACEIVVRGRLLGRMREFRFDGFAQTYLPDTSADPAPTRSELLDLMAPDDALTWMASWTGDALRLGGDRNDDAMLDHDTPLPGATLAFTAAGALLSWPDHPGWVPEWSASLPAGWRTLTAPRSPAPGFLSTTLTGQPRAFFRLRRTW